MWQTCVEFVTKSRVSFGYRNFNSKLETSHENTFLDSSMSDDTEEDHEDTAKCLDEDFPGVNKVRGTSKERMKTSITGEMSSLNKFINNNR